MTDKERKKMTESYLREIPRFYSSPVKKNIVKCQKAFDVH